MGGHLSRPALARRLERCTRFLGGTVGVGTVTYALGIGPLAHVFIPAFAIDGRRSRTNISRTPEGW